MKREGEVSVQSEHLGDHGEPCAECGAPLAGDQRYCLNCGFRRAGARIPFMAVLEERLRRELSSATGTQQSSHGNGTSMSNGLLMGLGFGLFVLVLGLGVLIGSLGGDDTKPAAATRPQVVTIAAPVGTSAPATASFVGDWAEGDTGFTIELETLPKEGTDQAAVDAAKQAAEEKGAADVGALDADEYSSLDSGNYVIYSGLFSTKKKARKALGKLKKDFPDARVIEVTNDQKGDPDALSGKKKEATVGRDTLKELEKTSPEEYQKKAKKLPDTTKLPGKAPPKDEKKPGGGTGGDVIE